jgi:cell division septation protein DedD
MSCVRNAVAIAAAVAAFFFIATPVTSNDLGTEAMTQLQNSILYKLIPEDTSLPAVEPVVEQATAKATVDAGVKTSTETKEETATQKPATTYCIIVASQVKLTNAERYVEQLKKEGFPDAYVYISNNVVRVVSAEFSNQADAYQQLNKMSLKEEFYEAWVYKKVANS